MARKHPRSYPPDFRHKVMELARTGRRIDGLASEFELAPQTIPNWLKQDDINGGRVMA